jgi:hypothetical protein
MPQTPMYKLRFPHRQKMLPLQLLEKAGMLSIFFSVCSVEADDWLILLHYCCHSLVIPEAL